MKKLMLALSIIMFVGFGINLMTYADNDYEEQKEEEITAVDTYSFTMKLAIPRIYNNS